MSKPKKKNSVLVNIFLAVVAVALLLGFFWFFGTYYGGHTGFRNIPWSG